MDAVKWTLIFLCLDSKGTQAETSSWAITVPLKVKGLPGSCVVIPCSVSYPELQNPDTRLTGIWMDGFHNVIYHPVGSEVMQQYRDRTELQGDLKQKDCSLKIDPLELSNTGPFFFRIEIEGHDKYSYKENTVSIAMIDRPIPITLSVDENVVEGQTASALCSTIHSCPAAPPVFTWNHPGKDHFHSRQLDAGQWEATSLLTFDPVRADHHTLLQCNATHRGGQHQQTSEVLKVKYAPVKLKVEYRSSVREGHALPLTCSSDAHPAAATYEWHNDSGAQLHTGSTYVLQNVSRGSGVLHCTALNTIGRDKSSPVRLSVLYAPVIRTTSACLSNKTMVTCLCIAESNPPSTVHFLRSGVILPSVRVDRHGSFTIATLHRHFGSSGFLQCLANNTLGNAEITLAVVVHNDRSLIYIAVAIGVFVAAAIIFTAVGLIMKWRGRAAQQQQQQQQPTLSMQVTGSDKAERSRQYSAPPRLPRKDMRDDVFCVYANNSTYTNMEADCEENNDDSIYANM